MIFFRGTLNIKIPPFRHFLRLPPLLQILLLLVHTAGGNSSPDILLEYYVQEEIEPATVIGNISRDSGLARKHPPEVSICSLNYRGSLVYYRSVHLFDIHWELDSIESR